MPGVFICLFHERLGLSREDIFFDVPLIILVNAGSALLSQSIICYAIEWDIFQHLTFLEDVQIHQHPDKV